MRKRILAFTFVLLSTGCSTMNNTEKGLLGGTAIGTVAGAAIGSATGHAGAGALIGGTLGAIGGGLTGNAVDNAEARGAARAAAAAEAQRPRVSLEEVVQMTHAHTPPATIINQIRTTNSCYDLTSDQIIWLRQQGVADSVVTEMQTRRPQYVQPVRVVQPGPTVIRETYVVEPRPAYVGVGVGWSPRGHYRRW